MEADTFDDENNLYTEDLMYAEDLTESDYLDLGESKYVAEADYIDANEESYVRIIGFVLLRQIFGIIILT